MAIITPAEFNPDHVTMHSKMSGVIPTDIRTDLVKRIMAQSTVMQLAYPVDMAGKREVEYGVLEDTAKSYVVGEGQVIPTTKLDFAKHKMKAVKIATMILTSREFLEYTMSDFFDVVKIPLAAAQYRKFDELALVDADNEWDDSITKAVAAEAIQGDITVENFDNLLAKVYDNGHKPNAIVSVNGNYTGLNSMIRDRNGYKQPLYDRNNESVDGFKVFTLDAKTDIPKGSLFLGDWDYARYAIPYNMTYAISTEATISSVVDEQGNPINLFERELMVLRVVMDAAFGITDPKAFAVLKDAEEPVVP